LRVTQGKENKVVRSAIQVISPTCRAFFILNQRRFSDEHINNYFVHHVDLYRLQNL